MVLSARPIDSLRLEDSPLRSFFGDFSHLQRQWLQIKEPGLRRFWSMFPLTRVPFWYRVLEPYPAEYPTCFRHFLTRVVTGEADEI